jgi:hypothetical protein
MKNESICAALFCGLFAVTEFAAAAESSTAVLRRGQYLTAVGGCNDCHTPLKMGPKGPEPDMSRMLSGHPAELKLPPPPDLGKGPWLWVGAGTNTAFAGPWGVTYSANLTPDKANGLGGWKAEDFIKTMRTGKHLGVGRDILPPMPWQNVALMTDSDLRALYAYLLSVPAISNAVPQYSPPSALGAKN